MQMPASARPLRTGWRCAVVRTGFSRFLIIAVIWRSATWRSLGVFAFFWSLHQYHDHGHKNMKTRPHASPRKSRDIELSEEQQEREGKSEDAISTPRQSRAVFAAIRSDRRTSRRTSPSMGTTFVSLPHRRLYQTSFLEGQPQPAQAYANCACIVFFR